MDALTSGTPRRSTRQRSGTTATAVLAPRQRAMHRRHEAVPVLAGRAPRASAIAPRARSTGGRGPWAGVAVALAAVALLLALYRGATGDPFEFGSTFFVAPLFLGLSLLLARLVGRRETAFDLSNIIFAGAGLRVILEMSRQTSGADSYVYGTVGAELAKSFRALQFDVDTQREFPGTGFVRYLSGLAQVVTFDDRYATSMVFTAFALVGAVFFYLAFARGLPDGNRQRYAVLVFLWPSMAYWPSSIGKEAWMVMSIGLASYGAALVLTNKTVRGFGLVVAGIAGTSMVRPHVSMIVMAAVAAAILIRKPARVSTVLHGRTIVRTVGSGAKVLAVVLVIGAGGYLATQTASVLKLDESNDSVGSGLAKTEEQTTQGGSAFKPFTVRNPANYPPAFVTVIFRPFPVEARSSDSLVSAAEGVTLLVLVGISLPRIARLPSTMRREAYAAYALVLVLVFVYAFSSIGNFGILARQRTQVLPLVFVLVCLPAGTAQLRRLRAGAAVESSPADPAESADDADTAADGSPARERALRRGRRTP